MPKWAEPLALSGSFSSSRAFGINDAGQVVGQCVSSTNTFRAFLVTPEDTDGNGAPDRWFRDINADGKNDLMRDLGTLGNKYTGTRAYDINNAGQVVGESSSPTAHQAFVWQNGVMTSLAGLAAQNSYAIAINNAGQITGSSTSGPFLWKSGVVTMGIGGDDINDAGQLIDGSRVWTPTVPNGASGTWTALGQLPSVWPEYPDYTARSTVAQSINGAGQIVGTQQDILSYGDNNSYSFRGVRWINGVPQALSFESASAINDGGQIVGAYGGRGYLLTDEQLVLPLLSISGAAVTEGNTGTRNCNVTVTLSRPSGQLVTVQYATSDGSATAGSDYLATSGTLTFAPGETVKTVSVTVFGDRIAEDEGDFSVTLSNASNNVISWGTTGACFIADDEPRISGTGGTVPEGNSGSTEALVTVTLTNAYDQTVTVDYRTANDMATAGSDYLATSGTVTFAPGQTTKQFSVTILGDHVPEFYNERVGIALSNPSANALVAEGSGRILIRDDEPFVSVSRGVSVSEGNAGTTDAVFTVSLSAPYDQDVTVEYLTSDPIDFEGWWATAGSDYAVTSGTLRIPAGQTSGTVRVPVIGDTLDESDEHFYLGLGNPSANAQIGGVTTYSVGEIRDDDGPAKTWVGPASGGNWSTAANWSPAGVPTGDDAVLISGNSVNLSASATVGSVNLISGATLTLGADGNRVLRASWLSVSPTSKLNLNDNDLILDYAGGASPIGEWNGSAYSGVTGMIARGYTFGDWTGNGLVTTTVQARTGVTTLAVAEAAQLFELTGTQTAIFSGQTVDATTVLVKYTYTGDVNLDGSIDGADYGVIDNWVQFPGTNRYENGDFNFDGLIDGADHGLIDNAIQFQGLPL